MRKHLFYSALLLTLANLLLRAIGMGFQVYLAGQVGAAGIGLMQLVLTVGGMAMTVGTSGVRVAGMYLCAEELGHGRRGGHQGGGKQGGQAFDIHGRVVVG